MPRVTRHMRMVVDVGRVNGIRPSACRPPRSRPPRSPARVRAGVGDGAGGSAGPACRPSSAASSVVEMPSPLRVTWLNGVSALVGDDCTLRFDWVAPSAAARSACAVPESRTSLGQRRARGTRGCWPVETRRGVHERVLVGAVGREGACRPRRRRPCRRACRPWRSVRAQVDSRRSGCPGSASRRSCPRCPSRPRS